MKLTTILLFLTGMSFAANTFSQEARFDLSVKNASIIQVFDEIERITDYGFLFKTDQLDVNKKYTLDFKNSSIEKILNEVLDKKQYSCQFINRNIVITRIDSNVSSQQQKSVSGKVTDSSGATLPGVSVVVKGTTTGTISDTNGSYSLPNIPENATLQFSFVGMKTQNATVGDKTLINVTLTEETIGIEEVVAVGYGTMKKSDLTGSISSVKSKDMNDLPSNNITQALQGRVAGVQIQQNSGAPGAAMQVRIRGGNTD